MSSVASPALVSSAPATVLVESVSHEDSAISKPVRSRLFKLMGRMWYRGGLAGSAKQIWWLTYTNKSEKRSNATVEKLEVILKLLTSKHNPNRVHFPDSTEKRPSRLHTRLMYFN